MKNRSVYFCDGCKWLSLTEAEQNQNQALDGVKFFHYCDFYDNQQVKHLGYHPHIVSLNQCNSWSPANNKILPDQLHSDDFKLKANPLAAKFWALGVQEKLEW